MSGHRIYLGANGYYVAWEDEDGYHRQPADNGARIGFDRQRAIEAMIAAEELDERLDEHA